MIFYFTGTGNSLFAAKKIANITNDSTADMSSALCQGKLEYNLSQGERLGFVFPVYFSGLPCVVAEFIKKAKIKTNEDTYVYAVVTFGGAATGSDVGLKKALSAKGMSLDYLAGVKMTDNYLVMFEIDEDEKIKSTAKRAADELDVIANEIDKRCEKLYSGGFMSKIANPFMQFLYERMRTTKKFSSNGCVACGLCEKICPVGAIEIKDGKPAWIKSKCSHCMACINRCPKKAINYGKKTVSRGRYVNDILK